MTELNFFYQPKIQKRRIERYTHKTLFLSLFLLIGFLTLYVWQRVTVIKLLKEIGEQKSLLGEEEKKYKYLNIEITELSSVGRIEKIARDELGLVYPSEEQIVRVDLGQLNRLTLPEGLWVKLKNFGKKLYPFEDKGLQAKGIKHDL